MKFFLLVCNDHTVGDKLSQRMNNKEFRTLRKKTRTMNKIEENELREKVIFIDHKNHLYIGVCTIGGRGSLNKPTNKSKPL